MRAIYDLLFAWIPVPGVRAAFIGLFTIAVIFIVLRVIKLVLDAIPLL